MPKETPAFPKKAILILGFLLDFFIEDSLINKNLLILVEFDKIHVKIKELLTLFVI